MMKVQYAFAKTIFGLTFLATIEDSILQISFVPAFAEAQELTKIRAKWPDVVFEKMNATWAEENLKKWIPRTFSKGFRPRFRMVEQGTAFQKKVWKALMQIPAGQTVCYSDIAQKIGHPRAVRAVGSAVGANPIGYLIPCHRVLPKGGGIGQFGWGPDLKKQMLQFERAL